MFRRNVSQEEGRELDGKKAKRRKAKMASGMNGTIIKWDYSNKIELLGIIESRPYNVRAEWK